MHYKIQRFCVYKRVNINYKLLSARIKFIKSEAKTFIRFIFKCCMFELAINHTILEKKLFHKKCEAAQLLATFINNKKCFLSSKLE